MQRLRIAVVGSGIAGLSAAWLLSGRHRVTLYEASGTLGGHANTVDVATPDGLVPVDTGFIVYNEQNYPNLTALLSHLGVATRPTEMSFSLSLDNGAYEYSGSGATGFFAQPRNVVRARHWRLASDIARFFRTAKAHVASCPHATTLGDFLRRENYSAAFVDDHIVPMGAAIWSSDAERMLSFPARSFIDFYANHGMLQFRDRTAWRTVDGGSRSYVEKLVRDGGFQVETRTPVRQILRTPRYAGIVDGHGTTRPFDHVVVATQADQALAILSEPDKDENRLLGSFPYQHNKAVLHRDPRWMPRRRRLWSSWNYLKHSQGRNERLSVTYWMNRLQHLATASDLFITLNPGGEIHPKAIDATLDYRHPVFTPGAMAAQKQLHTIQGIRRTWFCGSYFGYGFHEDGAQSGLAVAEALGTVRRPWRVANESGRISLSGDGMSLAAE